MRQLRRLLGWLMVPVRPHLTEVLAYVNAARQALHLPPLHRLPVGTAHQIDQCPLAQGLGGLVGVDGIAYQDPEVARRVANAWGTPYVVRGIWHVVLLPPVLRRFVCDYDLGAFWILERNQASESESKPHVVA